MSNNSPASRFIEDSVNHSEWLKTVEAGQAEAVVKLAKDNGYDCSLEDLKQAARDLLGGGEDNENQGHPDKKEIDDAASGMTDLETEVGYGGDTGYAALYGVAGSILKM